MKNDTILIFNTKTSNKIEYSINFNFDQYQRVQEKRKLKNLPIVSKQIIISNHPLLSKKIKNLKTNKIYNVEKVYKEFYFGWFYVALVECNQSHAILYIEDINCGEIAILNGINRFKNEYIILGDEINDKTIN